MLLQLLRAGARGPRRWTNPTRVREGVKTLRWRVGRRLARGLLRGAAAAVRVVPASRLAGGCLRQLGDHGVQLGLGVSQGSGGLVLRG